MATTTATLQDVTSVDEFLNIAATETVPLFEYSLSSSYETTTCSPPHLREKHQVDDEMVFVDDASWLQAACYRHGLRFQHVTHGNRNVVKRVFREIKRRTSSFSNSFSQIDPATAETWLQSFAVWWNSLN